MLKNHARVARLTIGRLLLVLAVAALPMAAGFGKEIQKAKDVAPASSEQRRGEEPKKAVAAPNAEVEAVVKIRDLGGECALDEQRPDAPVIGVHFRSVRVTDADLKVLESLPHLRSLKMGGRQLTDAGLVHLRGLTELEELRIRQTSVTAAGLTHLKGLTGLKKLDLGCNKIADAGLANLRGMTHLERLDLIANGRWRETNATTGITDAGLEHLKHLPQLRWLDLRYTQVTDDGVKKLQQALPNCKILPIAGAVERSAPPAATCQSKPEAQAKVEYELPSLARQASMVVPEATSIWHSGGWLN